MFVDRKDAGQRLAKALEKYRDTDVLVLAIPRGEFALITGYIGSLAGIISPIPFSLVVLLSSSTCVLAPLFIRLINVSQMAKPDLDLSPGYYTGLKTAFWNDFKRL